MALEQLDADLWVADGPVAIDLLVVPYPTRMTVVRLADGGLWVASPVPTPVEVLDALRELGAVRHLVSPTPRHHWRLESWHALFPDAALWSCRTGPFTLGDKRLPATVLTDEAPAAWAGQLDQAVYRGRGFEETTFLHRASRTLLVEDIVQSHRPSVGRPLLNGLIRFGNVQAPGGVPRDIRAISRRGARAWVERVLSWDFDRLVMAHGPVVATGARAYVERAFAWALR